MIVGVIMLMFTTASGYFAAYSLSRGEIGMGLFNAVAAGLTGAVAFYNLLREAIVSAHHESR